jgi:hypothetical protein
MLFLLLLCLEQSNELPEAIFCIFYAHDRCPGQPTQRYDLAGGTFDWAKYKRDEADDFKNITTNFSAPFNVRFLIYADLDPSQKINLSFVHGTQSKVVSFVGRGVTARHQIHDVYFESQIPSAIPLNFTYCRIHIPGPHGLSFPESVFQLTHSEFPLVDNVLRVKNLTLDLYSAWQLDSFGANHVVLSMAGNWWPQQPETLKLSRLVKNTGFEIIGIDDDTDLHLFGHQLIFSRRRQAHNLTLDVSAAVTAPIIRMTDEDCSLYCYCDFYVPHQYLPILIFLLETSSPLVFPGGSNWPNTTTDSGIVRVSCSGDHEQQLVLEEAILPISIRAWPVIVYNESAEDPCDMSTGATGGTDLLIWTNRQNVTITGLVEIQNCALNFDSEDLIPRSLTFRHLYEYSVYWTCPEDHIETGVYANNYNPFLVVRIMNHTKARSLIDTSTFYGQGYFEWDNFPETIGQTAVENLLVDSRKVYDVYYSHRYGGPVEYSYEGYVWTELTSVFTAYLGGNISVKFVDNPAPKDRILKLRPIYYWSGKDLPNNTFLNEKFQKRGDVWDFFQVGEGFTVAFVFPEYGEPGFEQATMFGTPFYNATDDSAVLIRKEGEWGQTFNYRFCVTGKNGSATDCPPDYFVLSELKGNWYEKHIDVNIAKQVKFFLKVDTVYDFSDFKATGINVLVAALSPTIKFTMPPGILTGNKLNSLHLKNVLLDVSGSGKYSLCREVYLEDARLSDQSVDRLSCAGTKILRATANSIGSIPAHCVPDRLIIEDFRLDRIKFFSDKFELSNNVTSAANTPIIVPITNGRPIVDVRSSGHTLFLDLESGVRTVPIINISMASDIINQTINIGPGFSINMADSVTISNIKGTINTLASVIPFKPLDSGASVRIVGQANQKAIQIKYTFSDMTALTTVDTNGAVIPLAFDDMSFNVQPGKTGTIQSIKFGGTIRFELGSAIVVEKVDFNDSVLNVVYGIRNGLPELMLGTQSTTGLPSKVNLIHSGENEEDFINSMSSSFTNWTQQLICGNNLACENWNIELTCVSSSPAFQGPDAIVKAMCLHQSEDPDGKCLAIQVNPRLPSTPTPNGSNGGVNKIAIAVGVTAGVGVVGLIVALIVLHVSTKKKYERLLAERAPLGGALIQREREEEMSYDASDRLNVVMSKIVV